MTVFISHSFDNAPEFDNLTDALAARQLAWWNPAEIKPGASLREQLHAAIERCSVCVFIATKTSVESSWCGAELGAFWGVGKPVIVYLAEPSLTEDQLPQVVQGDVWERRLARVAEQARVLVDRATGQAGGPAAMRRDSPITQLTVEQLQAMITGALSLVHAPLKYQPAQAQPSDDLGSALRKAAGQVLTGLQASQAAVAARSTMDVDQPHAWQTQVLWVDDHPNNNRYERGAMEAMGLRFTLATNTTQALALLADQRFAAIISDMGRAEGPQEGYALLQAVRQQDSRTPFFLYCGAGAPGYRQRAAAMGAQGCTNVADELVGMVTAVLGQQTSGA